METPDIPYGLSFDDVLLTPCYSGLIPAEANLSSRLTSDIPLNIPVISSAMDTVTEDRMAIALAREGGMGVIHRNNTIEEQAGLVARVKRSENIIISDPDTVTPDLSLAEIQAKNDQTGVSGFPVVTADGKLAGIVTRRDTWKQDPSKKAGDVMTPRERLVTAGPDVTAEEAQTLLYQNRVEKLLIVDESDRLVGLMTSADIEKSETFTDAAKDDGGHLRVGAAIGVGPDCFERAGAMADAGADALFIDAATGHTTRAVEVLRELSKLLPGVHVVAGNVVTEQGARDLIEAGAAAIKVGVGPGSICTTRVISGVGMPQFTAIQEAARACKPAGVTLIADGGIRYSGDIVKALAGGADLVMLGGVLAGTEESPGSMVRWQGRNFKEYRGMGSTGAMKKGSGDRYGQNSSGKLVPEGVEARVPFKGTLTNTIFQLMGGLRSGMGYVGATTLTELQQRAVFRRITAGGLKESHVHDITLTEEPINYSPSA